MRPLDTDVVVVGAGAAGLYTALRSAREGASTVLVSATALAESSTYWAQGGLAAALASDDSPELHLEDTIRAGRGLARESAARVLCSQAPAVIEDLQALGIRFDAGAEGSLALALEGGHSARRVVHAGGAATGQRLIAELSRLATEDPRVRILEGHRAISLLVDGGGCAGVGLGDGTWVSASSTVLATGGAAALWARTTNPAGAVGGGLLLAASAGADLADLEFVQFHPTAVAHHDGVDGFLVTEAVRGEGAFLLNASGQRFVDELAPRDEVARAVHHQMALTGRDSVSLDMREIDPRRFPNVVQTLREAGIDPERQLIPVAPAAHYMMGGIATDLDGRSSVAGLYAVGECSCTGVHGANRLASNSLTECLVFGARAARAAASETGNPRPADPTATPAPGSQPVSRESREALWRYAALDRDAAGLHRLAEDPHPLVGLIGACALAREESRGAHHRTDFPELDRRLDGRHVVVQLGGEPAVREWK